MKAKRFATKQQKALLCVMQECSCAHCGATLASWEADHIVEWSRGGGTTTNNLQLLCQTCHKTKTRSFLARDSKT